MPRRSFASSKQRDASKAHGSEPPFSKRYGEGITSTTKGRGARTKGLNPAFRIHLASVVPVEEEMCPL